MNNGIENCICFLHEKYALDISMYDPSFIEKTIKSRMTALFCRTIEGYMLCLEKLPAETTKLLDQLSNSYSEFFRNPITFAYLEQVILPLLLSQKVKSNEKEIRIWSAACASGQEAYSVAILCDELMENINSDVSVRIFATDKSSNELINAQKGNFQAAALRKVAFHRVKKYFTQHDENFTILQSVKDLINFSEFDLLSVNGACPPASIYGNFDLVFCTNLLFYYKTEYQNRILEKGLNCLSAGGYLITGEAEREIGMRNNLREIFLNSGIFQKR